MRIAMNVGRGLAAMLASAVAGLPVTIFAISLLAFHRWRVLPFAGVLQGVSSSAGWYWIALLPSAGIPCALRLSPGPAAMVGAALAAVSSVPCVAGLTGRTITDVLLAASSRHIEFAIIAGSMGAGGAVAGLCAAWPARIRRHRR